MLPALRLAIRSLSVRRGRTALLALAVALSAALVTAVSVAMHSLHEAARAHVEALVGPADVVIRPAGAGRTFDEALLHTARTWPGVARAWGVASSPIRISATVRALVRDESGGFVPAPRRLGAGAIAVAHADVAPPSPVILDAGRLPESDDEIVIDGTLGARLSLAGAGSESPFELPARIGGRRPFLTGPHPPLPARVADPGQAGRLNAGVGVRIGDTIEVVRQVLPDVDLSALLADPARAGEMARAAGVTPSLGTLADLLRTPVRLTVVGIARPPPFGGRPRAFVTRGALRRITGVDGQLREVHIILAEGVSPEEFVARHRADVPEHVLVQTAARITAGLDQDIMANRLGLLLATAMAFLAAGFIIATGMTTALHERLREMGILRAIGAGRAHLAVCELTSGLTLGVLGSVLGLPLGLLVASGVVRFLQRHIEVSLRIPWWGVVLAAGGAVLCGLAGAIYPARFAARLSPLRALGVRSVTARREGIARALALGVMLAGVQLATVTLTRDGQVRFWAYIFLGLPALFGAYFLLSVPALALVNRLAGEWVSRLLRLPTGLLPRAIRATPYRNGFTAGAMMMGMALLTAIWTQGAAIRRDYLDTLRFPDAFVTGFNLSEDARRAIEAIPGVAGTCAITLHPVRTGIFGVRGLQTFSSVFIAFEPRAFFDMTRIEWVEGDPRTGVERLERGGAILVAREFSVARGLGVGDSLTCRSGDREATFEIVGVVTSPGLEVVSQFFAVGESFTEQSLHAVFGSRADLGRVFGSDAVHLIQIDLDGNADDSAVLADIRERLAAAGILEAGSGRAVKRQIEMFIDTAMLGASMLGLFTMILAGLGVANILIAGITARRFEFGVLRAVGASKWLTARLILGEGAIIAISAAALGTCMGLQGIYAAQRIDELLFGLALKLRPPPAPIALGWVATLLMTLLAALAPALSLARRHPRELLVSVRG
jgi:putative ABC transport system permease protein